MIYSIKGFDKTKLKLHETLFHNANGYLGVRSCFEEGYPEGFGTIRGMYVSGVYNIAEMPQAEPLYGFVDKKQAVVNIADAQGIELYIDGERFSPFDGEALEFERALDMEAGVTCRRIHWRSPRGKEAEVLIKRMASFVKPSLFTIEYCVTPLNFSGEIRVISGLNGHVTNHGNPGDPRVASERRRHMDVQDELVIDGVDYVVSATSRSGIKVCVGAGHKTRGLARSGPGFIGIAKPGVALVLEKYVVVVDSRRHKDVLKAAQKEMQALKSELSSHYDAQKAYLADFWERSAMEIEGNGDLNLAMRFNLYQLLQSAPEDSVCGMAAKGLSGEGYEGHCFWDGEMFAFPALLLTQPEIARKMLMFRYNTLNAAIENARFIGHKNGALFPWRTINGTECSGYYPSGAAQYHINGDIGYAVVQYWLVSGDVEFMQNAGLELLLQISRLWLDTGHYHNGRFMINGVTGPDEYTCMVNNNYYTNALAKHNMRWTAKLAETAGLASAAESLGIRGEELKAFRQAAEAMYLPYDKNLGINPQDDSFLQKPVWDFGNTPPSHYPLLLHYHPMHLYRFQVCKQADVVMAHFILEDEQSRETMEKSFLYYEKVTTHDSSLSKPIFCAVAAKLGVMNKATGYFKDSANLDLRDSHGNTSDGIHTANMGGTCMAALFGFAGLRINDEGISLEPRLPPDWQGFTFRIMYRGELREVRITRDGKGCAVNGVKTDGGRVSLRHLSP